jgi:hypothetical protein
MDREEERIHRRATFDDGGDTMDLEESIIRIYCCVSEIVEDVGKLRGRGYAPGLSDAEELTMEIVGEMQERSTDAGIWRYFQEHWRGWFPRLGSYCNFAKHCANLRWLKEQVMMKLFPPTSTLHVIDGVPMPLCHYARSRR